jgi:hypothetical protein
MSYKILWSGLADDNYYNVIARHCLPSWFKLPGHKQVIHDASSIHIPSIEVAPWDPIPNMNSNFLKISPSKKTWNFWRKMQSQVWAVRKYKTDYDFIVLLDTDIEILDFDAKLFDQELKNLLESNCVWMTGQSQLKKLDAGFITINTKHPLLDELITYYENIWETNKIFELPKSYDGDAVSSMFDIYPSYKLKNTDYGKGMHIYDVGAVHWGSKEPKALRAAWGGDGKSLVEKRLSEIVIKKKKSQVQ